MSELLLGHGFSTITHTDHRAWIWVASFLSLIYSVLCLAARFTGKWGLLWWDDLVLCVGYIFALAHWGLLYGAVSEGLAVSSLALTSQELAQAARIYFAARIPLFLAHCLAKLSILVFTRRIFSGEIYKQKVFFGISYTVCVIYGILAVLLSSAGCRPDEALAPGRNAVCGSNVSRWATLTAFDGISEITVLLMPAWFISKNQLKASKKRIVVFVYMFRLIVIAFTIATTVSYFNFLEDGSDSIDIAPVVAWHDVLLAFSLISASFPCLRSFIWAFMSRGLLTMYGNTTISSSLHGSRSASMQLRSLNKYSHASRHGSETGESRSRLRLDQATYHVEVEASGSKQPGASESSGDSHRMTIRQDTSYRVETSTV